MCFIWGDAIRHPPEGLEEELKGDLKGLASLGTARFPLSLVFSPSPSEFYLESPYNSGKERNVAESLRHRVRSHRHLW